MIFESFLARNGESIYTLPWDGNLSRNIDWTGIFSSEYLMIRIQIIFELVSTIV